MKKKYIILIICAVFFVLFIVSNNFLYYTVRIESNTAWLCSIDGEPIKGSGDTTIHLFPRFGVSCILTNLSDKGFVKIIVNVDGSTSSSDSDTPFGVAHVQTSTSLFGIKNYTAKIK